MIDDKLKEAWRKLNAYRTGDLVEPAEIIILDAYIEAEWQRRKVEFLFDHHYCVFDDCPQKNKHKHNFTDADWRRELEEELER